MKRFLIFILLSIMVLVLSACGNSSSADNVQKVKQGYLMTRIYKWNQQLRQTVRSRIFYKWMTPHNRASTGILLGIGVDEFPCRYARQ